MEALQNSLGEVKFKYSLALIPAMPEGEDGGLVEFLQRPDVKAYIRSPEFEGFVEGVIKKYAPNGVLEIWGPTAQCVRLEEYDSYIADTLPGIERGRLEQHMASCEPCTYFLREIQHIKHLADVMNTRDPRYLFIASILPMFAEYFAELAVQKEQQGSMPPQQGS